MIGIILFTSRC